MSDIIVAAIAALAAVGGALVSTIAGIARTQLENRMLAQEMQETNQQLWQWNRELVDHIYRRLPPPPPPQPDHLFGGKK
jgi:uncharacterized membrane-anchored protein YhcB (DUF1043 family)